MSDRRPGLRNPRDLGVGEYDSVGQNRAGPKKSVVVKEFNGRASITALNVRNFTSVFRSVNVKSRALSSCEFSRCRELRRIHCVGAMRKDP
jgi:hypothetical protein